MGAMPFVKLRCISGKQVGLGLGMDGPSLPSLLPKYASGLGGCKLLTRSLQAHLGLKPFAARLIYS